jgi:hypothetical protein
MFDTLVAPKTLDSLRRTASKTSRAVPVACAGSTMRIVVIVASSTAA